MAVCFSRLLVCLVLASWVGSVPGFAAGKKNAGDELFAEQTGVRHLRIEIPKEGIETLRQYNFRRGNESERESVPATVREGTLVWTNVAVHLKGQLGSFRSIDQKPALTLNFDKWADGQAFHGLKKISLNNSVQDPSYLNEKICREIYNAAGVPTPRADYATMELNGRYLGLFVLTEGWNKQFLQRHFKNTKGNFYDLGGGRDINRPWDANFGSEPTNHAMLKTAERAALAKDHAERLRRLRESLDLDRFLKLTALDVMMWNWDGYAMNRNNYRIFHDLESNRLVFFPHGVDQMFWKVNGPIVTGRSGLLVKAALETEEGRDLYLKTFSEVRMNVFDVKAITNRITQVAARLHPSVAKNGLGELGQFQSHVNLFRSRVMARARDVDQQLASVKDFRRLKVDESMPVTDWVAEQELGRVLLARTESPAALHLKVSGETSFGAWTSVIWLEEGRYVLEGRARTRGVEGGLRNETGGAGFRTWSDRKETRGASWGWFPYGNTRDRQLGGLIPVVTNSVEQRLTGTTEWQSISHEFELRQPLADVQIQCVLQASGGEAWFDLSSIRIRRLSSNLSRVSSTVRGE